MSLSWSVVSRDAPVADRALLGFLGGLPWLDGRPAHTLKDLAAAGSVRRMPRGTVLWT